SSTPRLLTRREGARALAALLLTACASSPAPAPAPPRRPVPPLHRGPLADYVPAAGLRWMVLGKPRAVAQHPSFRDSLGLLFPQARLLAFAQGAGVDLREI